jgi:uncharacterized protein
LFGVLVVNLITEFRVSIFQQFLGTGSAPPGSFDAWVERIVTLAFEEKAFCLFALLFGAGLAIQYDRLHARGRPLYWLVRRLAVLLVLGLLHLLLVWNGDILTEYALAGLVALPFLLLPAPGLLVASFGFLVLYAVGPALYSVPWPNAAALQSHVALANQVYATGTLAEIWRFSFKELPLILSLHLFVFPRTLALFLFGMFLWRAAILRRARAFVHELFIAAVFGVALGGALSGAAHGPFRNVGIVLLALGYGAALVALAQVCVTRRLFSVFAPMGRMAFTNYVMQSLICGFVFFGYGLGQFGQIGATSGFAIAVAIYVVQIVLSRWWLRRYRFGPIEWLWRTLMYGTAQPMSNAASRTRVEI